VLPEAVHDFLQRHVARTPSILALDYDGTLAPFRVERMQATPLPAVVPVLRRLQQARATRLVIVSGRPVRELAALLPLRPPPELWGVHGGERQSADGSLTVAALPASAEAALAEEHARLTAAGVAAHVERKSAALALHWRGLPMQEALAAQDLVSGPWAELCARHDFIVRPFDGGIELRSSGVDKGRVVTALLDGAAAGTPLAYLGDDDTDEDAFHALRQPAAAARTLGVRVRTVPVPTAASAEVAPQDVPELLVEWLRATRRVAMEGTAQAT
jgi:trehalose-phosphatase